MSEAVKIRRRRSPKTLRDASGQTKIPFERPATAFDAEFAKLNEAQRAAVEAIEGPVLCLAGPGTGKTQVTALRVANILRRTQMRPGNILCLTFSVSGATAMRQRLRSLIGPDAYGVTVSTIHGFCNDVIGQHPGVFEAWAALEQISDVEQYRLVNAIIDSLLPDLAIVNRKNPYVRTKDIIARISQVKREGKTLADLERAAATFRTQMERESKEGTKAKEKDLLSARKFEEFVKIFAAYQEALLSSQRYDYDDMILQVIRAFQEEEWLLGALQERYQYILVDEFQDTNGAQNRVIELLTTYPTLEHAPNLFVVGDDDQAIYRFQGANLQNILSFLSRFPEAEMVVLETSYRSTQTILDAAGRLIARNDERLIGKVPGLRKDLRAATGEEGSAPRLITAPSDMAEPWLVADIVEDRMQQGTPPAEIAILTQTNAELRPLYDVLRARGIPVQMEGKLDLLTHPLVQQLTSLLRAIENPESNAALSAALSCDCFACHPADVARLNLARREKEMALFALLLRLAEQEGPTYDLQLRDRAALIRARDVLLDFHQNLGNRTIIATLERVIRECGILRLSLDEASDPIDVAAVRAFFDHVRYRAYEQSHFGLQHLLRDLDLYASPENALRLHFAMPHLQDNGVRILTAHQSKGLEFDIVILVNFREGHWDRRRNPPSLSLPEDLLFGWDKDVQSFERTQDERRVAYVAMTRARKELIFTCPRTLTGPGKSRDVSPSGFFVEAGPLPEEDGVLKHPEAASTFLFTPLRHLDDEFKTFLRHRLETFSLSATALNHFLKDPRLFLERDLLEVPDVPERSLVYGSAVHAALKKWGMSVQAGLPIGLDRFMDEFRNYIVDREITTESDRINILASGEENLPRYYDLRLAKSAPFIHKVEYPLRARLSEIPLKGSIDRLDLAHPDSATATVIDYKTGHPQTESQIRDGDYFRQLVFYAILLHLSRVDLKPQTFTLDFIGEGIEHPVARSFEIGEREREELSAVIRAVWEKITALDFTPL